jgi:hypothetical protein
MLGAGIVPFGVELRHLSYGDKEWVSYYNKQHDILEQIEYGVM